MIDASVVGGDVQVDTSSDTYDAVFDLGHRLRLFDQPGTFRLSPAGLALGDYLVNNLGEKEICGRVLEIGTGSGAIALLLRRLGVTNLAATDISRLAVLTALRNELANFNNSMINFSHSDLFPAPHTRAPGRFDLVVFNPPGWRAPSKILKAALDGKDGSLNVNAMFHGDSVLLRFIQQLPRHLARNGRAIVGFNSLVGISDIIKRVQEKARAEGGHAVHFRLLERVEFPLFFYADEWVEKRALLLEEFERGRHDYSATYIAKDEAIHWFFEITELTLRDLSVHSRTEVRPQPATPIIDGQMSHERC
ncbi:MAG: methyltransferase [Angustibacter sp.]